MHNGDKEVEKSTVVYRDQVICKHRVGCKDKVFGVTERDKNCEQTSRRNPRQGLSVGMENAGVC